MLTHWDFQGQERLKEIHSQPENPFSRLVPEQKIVVVPKFRLESGVCLEQVPVAYKHWGQLNRARNNCIVICHALTGSADAADWWGPLIGSGKAFDITRFFVICVNSLGSPYGTASPVTKCPETGDIYGPEFPLTTVRDDVNIHRLVLQYIGVKQVAMVVGGSMGGMLVLEWAFCRDYVRTIVPMATSARHSAWCISWGEAQRQSIYSDPKYLDGYYPLDDRPDFGLGAARMSALLTYRSRNSFETRFGRAAPNPTKQPYPEKKGGSSTPTDEHWDIHNEGHLNRRVARVRTSSPSPSSSADQKDMPSGTLPDGNQRQQAPFKFNAQNYLRYQAKKFVARFDPNCYIAITRKLDTHDIARDRYDDIQAALESICQPALVLGIESDGLFTFAEQEEIASHIPNSRLERIVSPEGHDGFLLEFDQVNRFIMGFQEQYLDEFMKNEAVLLKESELELDKSRPSVFGEVDDMTTW